MAKMENAVDEYILGLRSLSNYSTELPNISEIEGNVKELILKSKSVYMESVSDFISAFPETETSESKQE